MLASLALVCSCNTKVTCQDKVLACYRSQHGEDPAMTCRVCLAMLLGVAVTISCAAQASFSHAIMQASCAPWDGPAIDIRLTSEAAQCKNVSGPYIDMGVWRGLPIHGGQVVTLSSSSRNEGFASKCSTVGDCERAQSGTINFDTYKEGSGATGHYELHFKSGDVLGKFDAKWCEERIVCR